MTHLITRPYLYILCMLAVTLTSCSASLYFPESANTPAFKGANEFKGTLGFKAQDNTTSGSAVSPCVDAAYSVTPHFAVIGSYKSVFNMYTQLGFLSGVNNGNTYNGHRFEGGGGYYTTFNKKGRFEVFGGYGNGYVNCRGSDYYFDNSYSAHYHRFFVQPAAGYSNDIFSIMCGVKLAAQVYYNFQSFDPDLHYRLTDNNVDVTQQVFTFMEPFTNVEIGYQSLRMSAQVGYSGQIGGGKIDNGSPLYYSVGFTFYYAQRFMDKQKPHKPLTTEE